MTTKTNRRVDGELLHREFDPAYNRVSEKIKNTTGGVVALDRERFVGYPVKGAAGSRELALAADHASFTGLLLLSHHSSLSLAATTGESPEEMAVLVRGPAVVNAAMLAQTDYAGSAINQSNFIARLAALNIVVKPEGPQKEVQST
jgi:hypothetical protein